MRLAPVSGDLVVKLALTAVAIGAAWYVLTKAQKEIAGAADAAAEWARNVAATGLNPTSDQNYAYRAASAVASGITGREDTAGTAAAGAIYDPVVTDMLAGRTNVNGYYPNENLGATP